MQRNLGYLVQALSTLSSLPSNTTALNQEVKGITSDSRKVGPGFIFVAIRGGTSNGHQFLEDAQNSGALLLIGEEPMTHALRVPYLRVGDARLALAQLSASFYGNVSRSLLMIGVTGTSGKTTTTYLIESILQAAGHRVGVIGTINIRYDGEQIPSTHTTPDATELQKILYEMKERGCTAVVMEVSSHALKQHRVAGITFDSTLFTNLTPEHLDFHPDMEDYFRSKAMLFTVLGQYAVQEGKHPIQVINQEDVYGQRLLVELRREPVGADVYGFSKEQLSVTLDGITGQLYGIPILSKLTGHFNCLNISGAVTLCHFLKVKAEAIELGVRQLTGVPGRLEQVENARGIHVWVDYAHKPDALEKVLKSLQRIKNGFRLITVVGCGGDRDRKKRPVMGKIAVQHSDHVFITSDNPRKEDPQAIIREILEGVTGYANFTVEVDRKKAIFAAIQAARAGDLVLIAGKGHENYQILGTQKVHFDDKEVASEALEKLFLTQPKH